jgi:hypothetical protein
MFLFCSASKISGNKETECDTEEEANDDDKEYQPDVIVPVHDDVQPLEETSFSGAINALHGTLLKFQVKRKFVGTLSDGTRDKIKQKYKRSKKLFKEQFAAAVAPGQEDDILKMVSSSSEEEDTNVSHLVKLYHASDSRSRYERVFNKFI